MNELEVVNVAKEMANVFEAGQDNRGLISEDTRSELIRTFGDVPEQDRARVFLAFLEQLDERHIDYDKEQM